MSGRPDNHTHPSPSAVLKELVQQGHIGHFERRFAEALARRCAVTEGRASPAQLEAHRGVALWLPALVARHALHGHVCVKIDELEQWCPREITALWPNMKEAQRAWDLALRHHPGVEVRDSGAPSEAAARPLVREGPRVYLRRNFDDEVDIAHAIGARVGHTMAPSRTTEDALSVGSRLLPGSDAQQLSAVRRSLHERLLVLTGGPGTGKTTTVVAALAAVAAFDASASHPRSTNMLLLAPTGKAATRLREAVGHTLGKAKLSDAISRCIPRDVITVHRFLANHMRHTAGAAPDLVVVDEASMVDSSMMARLLRTIPEQCRLLLVGDADQLSSVEAGSVFRDLCAALESSGNSTIAPDAGKPQQQLGLPFEGRQAPAGVQPTDSPHVVRLKANHRQDGVAALHQLAQFILAGDAQAARRLLEDDTVAAVALDTSGGLGTPHALVHQVLTQASAIENESSALARLTQLDSFRVLCAHQQGRRGALALNRSVQEQLWGGGGATGLHDGCPILVRENDAATGLANGDQGVVMGGAPPTVAFATGGGATRVIAASQLPRFEPLYAMSIHKSQGSEMDEVAILLPAKPSPILSRELLYTAVTRAKKRVTLYATAEVFRFAVSRSTNRSSGLAERLGSPHESLPRLR